jgi:hypothetical protein
VRHPAVSTIRCGTIRCSPFTLSLSLPQQPSPDEQATMMEAPFSSKLFQICSTMACKSSRVAFPSAWGPDPHTQINHTRLYFVSKWPICVGVHMTFRPPVIDVWIGWFSGTNTCCARNCTTALGPATKEQHPVYGPKNILYHHCHGACFTIYSQDFCRDVKLGEFQGNARG